MPQHALAPLQLSEHELTDVRRRLRVLEQPSGCWERNVAPTTRGYTQIRVRGVQMMAHRVAYELERGSIPHGLVIDHLCRNTACVNPDHLEPVSERENITVRGQSPAARSHRSGQCARGHQLILGTEGKRHCKTCRRDARLTDEARARRREYIREYMRAYRSRKAT